MICVDTIRNCEAVANAEQQRIRDAVGYPLAMWDFEREAVVLVTPDGVVAVAREHWPGDWRRAE